MRTEQARLRGDDLLARERSAAALDHVAAVVDLVGAVDVDRQLVDLVAVEHRNADRLQALGRTSNWRPRLIWSFMLAGAAMNLLTVEPVPTPTISPGAT